MVRIIWTSHITNIDVGLLHIIGVKETTMTNTQHNQKKTDAGHITRDTAGHYNALLRTIEGRRQGKRGRGRQRQTLGSMILETGLDRNDTTRFFLESSWKDRLMGHLQATAVDATTNECAISWSLLHFVSNRLVRSQLHVYCRFLILRCFHCCLYFISLRSWHLFCRHGGATEYCCVAIDLMSV